MDSDQLVIGYAGGLGAYDPGTGKKNRIKRITRLFWDYRVDNINNNTRSGYYLFKALEKLKQIYPEMASRVKVQLWGMIDPVNAGQVKEMGLEGMVEISGYCSREESYRKLMACDVLFLPLESSKNGQKPLFIPGKLFEYLKTKKPVLSLAEPSDCTEILARSGLGLITSPYDSEAAADRILYLLENKSDLDTLFKANEDYIAGFRFSRIAEKVADVFNDVLSKK